jgi:hypothetical protein
MATVYKIAGEGPPDSPSALGVAVSSTTTYYSQPVTQSGNGALSLHCVFAGTMTGTLTLWLSNKPNADRTSDTDWVQDTTFTAVSPAGAASKSFYTVGNLAGVSVRLKYVNASGSGTWNAWAKVSTGV